MNDQLKDNIHHVIADRALAGNSLLTVAGPHSYTDELANTFCDIYRDAIGEMGELEIPEILFLDREKVYSRVWI
jgi:hypothetical protein